MANDVEGPAEQIAGDLALAIYQGLIPGGEQLPSQSKLMKSYGVAMATAAAALAKLSAAGLTRGVPGRGTYAVDVQRMQAHPVLEVMAAASLCRSLAALTFGPGEAAPTVGVDGDLDEDTSGDREPVQPRQVEVSALILLDRQVLRWMSEAFLSAARRLVGAGQREADAHLLAAARAILRDGGRRPEGQPAIAIHGMRRPADEDVALRIWPERGDPAGPDGPPF
ncbi:GntR family transcriptional regulator [Streptomyces sp. MS1.AVA.4]|uniref:GntR family transcriptional regulator n=1 Tax=Streptomyces pratisoli TaxID=3139917 RepID=A0ACC6QVA0_9ACTN